MNPRVGVGVIVKKDGKILIGKRVRQQNWCIPGGHLEFFEELEKCAERELFEETGIKAKNLKFVGVTNDIYKNENKHYISVWFEGEWHEGKEIVKEPHNFIELKWVKWEELPENLCLPLKLFKNNGNKPKF